MNVLRFLLSVSLLGLAATVAQADGAKSDGVALPAPQPSVVVTVERGVRVWRPVGTEGGGTYPQAVSLGSEPSVTYVTPGSGVTGVYGGFGGFSNGKAHQKQERWNGASFGSRHVNLNIKGWGARSHGSKVGHIGGRRHGGMMGGGPKHAGFHKGGGQKHVGLVSKGGGAKHIGGGGHGRGRGGHH